MPGQGKGERIMKEINIFNAAEKKIAKPLLKAKENGDKKAAIAFTKMWIKCHKRALAEYKKHPLSETITTNSAEFDEFWPQTVADKIKEISSEIEENEKWLKGARS